MARWNPADKPVGTNEPIGRRLFDEPLLAGADDQRKFAGLDLRNFEEKRDREFSVDRLGRTGKERAVIKYLNPRANAAALKFKPPKRFNGWTVLRAKNFAVAVHNFPAMPVTASPIRGDELEENIFHAHLVLPAGKDHYETALHLRHLFSNGEIVVQQTRVASTHSFGEWIRNLVSRALIYISG